MTSDRLKILSEGASKSNHNSKQIFTQTGRKTSFSFIDISSNRDFWSPLQQTSSKYSSQLGKIINTPKCITRLTTKDEIHYQKTKRSKSNNWALCLEKLVTIWTKKRKQGEQLWCHLRTTFERAQQWADLTAEPVKRAAEHWTLIPVKHNKVILS